MRPFTSAGRPLKNASTAVGRRRMQVFVIVFLYMVLFLGAANDMENEKDKDYVMNVFTGLVSIAALVISIITISR